MGPIVERLPRVFRTRRGFAFLLGLVALFGYGGWHLAKGDGLAISLVAGLSSGLTVFLLSWLLFSLWGTGFDD